MKELRVIHCLNQFFGGFGGEEKAGMVPLIVEGPKGPGNLVQNLVPDMRITHTVVFGDNYMAERGEAAIAEVLDLLRPIIKGKETGAPHVLLAGPAFNAGRYGLACGAICKAVAREFSIPVVSAMFAENPAVVLYRKDIIIAQTSDNVMGMSEALKRMAALGRKLVSNEELTPKGDGYIAQGRRKNVFSAETGAKRAVDMLLCKIQGRPFVSEYPMPIFDRVEPAPAISDMAKCKLALVTSGGIVPLGNPDRIEAANASRFGIYPLADLKRLSPETHQSVHGGYDNTYANADPNRVLPLDVVRELEAEGKIGALHCSYYATVGNATSVAAARRFGEEIAAKLLADGVQAVILTST